MSDFLDGVTKLHVSGVQTGTAWLLTKSIACTAAHCVEGCRIGDTVRLDIHANGVEATVIDSDSDLDVALLRIDVEHSAEPLTAIARPMQLSNSTKWRLHGYPVLHDQHYPGGLTLDGHISNARSIQGGVSLIQLFCSQGDRLPNVQSPFGGISGSPVVVQPYAVDSTQYAIGIMSHHHLAQDNILFCSPIDALAERFKNHLKEASIVSWDAYRRFVTIVKDENGFRTNLDEQLLDRIWQNGMTGMWCNVLPDASPSLSTAIERIVVQAPFATASPNTTLYFSGADAWKSKCEKCATDWVPRDYNPVKETLSRYSFSEPIDLAMPTGGVLFANIDDLTTHLRTQCNAWSLRRIRIRVSEALDNPLGELSYEIAADVLGPMRELWSRWVQLLEADPEALHHFFGLMLSTDGGVRMAGSGAGTGPETLDVCVLRATIFTLAVCLALPAQIQTPRSESPGNLGEEPLGGHSCGVQTMQGKNLQLHDRSHKWKTSYVMLPHLPVPWELFEASEARLDKDVDDQAASLNAEPAASLVIPGDGELLAAIGSGVDRLRSLLNQRYQAFVAAQEEYVSEATNVDA